MLADQLKRGLFFFPLTQPSGHLHWGPGYVFMDHFICPHDTVNCNCQPWQSWTALVGVLGPPRLPLMFGACPPLLQVLPDQRRCPVRLLQQLPADRWGRIWRHVGAHERRVYDIVCLVHGMCHWGCHSRVGHFLELSVIQGEPFDS